MNNAIDRTFWAGKRALVTGHTGFMGGWLSVALREAGAKVCGYALAPPTDPSFYKTVGVSKLLDGETIGDIRDTATLAASFQKFSPQVLFHLAAQPLVREAYRNPVETFDTNVMGTVNVLEAARHCPDLKTIVVVTSDKVYENVEWSWDYRENDRLGGFEPYGTSKACAEIVIDAYRHSYLKPNGIGIASVRAGNVVGGGDWAAERIIPDIVRAFSTGQPLIVRNPASTRPWQHVLEPIRGYLLLAERVAADAERFAGGWNFGPEREDHKPVSWIADTCVAAWGGNARWQLETGAQPYEAKRLGVTYARAESLLGWAPRWRLAETLQSTMGWYRAHLDGADMLAISRSEIARML